MWRGVEGQDLKTGEIVDGKWSIGMPVKTTGIWLCVNPATTETWKNKAYWKLLEATGLVDELPENEDGTKNLAEIDKKDVLGLPVMVSIKNETDKRDVKNNVDEPRKYPKAFDLYPWTEGEPLDKEEIADMLDVGF